MKVLDNCQLEWDQPRGVLYIHNRETGKTLIRIQGLSTRGMESDTELHFIDLNVAYAPSTIRTSET